MINKQTKQVSKTVTKYIFCMPCVVRHYSNLCCVAINQLYIVEIGDPISFGQLRPNCDRLHLPLDRYKYSGNRNGCIITKRFDSDMNSNDFKTTV